MTVSGTYLVNRCCAYAYSDKGIDPVSLSEVVIASYAVCPCAVGLMPVSIRMVRYVKVSIGAVKLQEYAAIPRLFFRIVT